MSTHSLQNRGLTLGTIVLVALAGLLLSAPPARAGSAVESGWQDGNVSIDGSAEDWSGAMIYLDRAGLYFGVRNDDRFLYLCLSSSDPQMGTGVLFRGLTVDFGNDFTIQYPMGMKALGGPLPAGAVERVRMRERATESLDWMMLPERGKREPDRLPVRNEFGVEARITTEPGFVYELKVPLAQSEAFPHAVGAGPGDKITIRVDTPEVERPEMAERPGGYGSGRPGGGMGGGMSGYDRDDRPGGLGRRPGMPEPIQFKVKVVLAAPPAPPK